MVYHTAAAFAAAFAAATTVAALAALATISAVTAHAAAYAALPTALVASSPLQCNCLRRRLCLARWDPQTPPVN